MNFMKSNFVQFYVKFYLTIFVDNQPDVITKSTQFAGVVAHILDLSFSIDKTNTKSWDFKN